MAERLEARIAATLGAAESRRHFRSGICGQLDGCIGVDRSGNAMGPAIIWMDKRAANSLRGIDTKNTWERTGIVLDASHMAAKIKWCRENLPSAADSAAWHEPTSFMVEKLTDKRVIDPCLASTSMVYGLHSQAWDEDLLAFRIEAPAPHRAHNQLAGRLSVSALPSAASDPACVAVAPAMIFRLLGCGISAGTVCITIGTGGNHRRAGTNW